MKKIDLKLLAQIYTEFFKIGLFTFGGGLAMMPMIQKELIVKRSWMTDEDLIDYYAIGQSTPGIIAVNVATFVGYKKAGIIGGIIGTLGIVSPSLLIIMLLAGLIDSIDHNPLVQKALKGINVAVAALLTDVSLNCAKKSASGVFSVFIMLITFALVYFFKIPSFYIIIGASVAGIAIYLVKNRRAAGKSAGGNGNSSAKKDL